MKLLPGRKNPSPTARSRGRDKLPALPPRLVAWTSVSLFTGAPSRCRCHGRTRLGLLFFSPPLRSGFTSTYPPAFTCSVRCQPALPALPACRSNGAPGSLWGGPEATGLLHRVFAMIYTLCNTCQASPCRTRPQLERVKHTTPDTSHLRRMPDTRVRRRNRRAESPGSRPGFPPGSGDYASPHLIKRASHLLSMSAWISSITCSFCGVKRWRNLSCFSRNSRTGRLSLGL